jgi:hypothetical protein
MTLLPRRGDFLRSLKSDRPANSIKTVGIILSPR